MFSQKVPKVGSRMPREPPVKPCKWLLPPLSAGHSLHALNSVQQLGSPNTFVPKDGIGSLSGTPLQCLVAKNGSLISRPDISVALGRIWCLLVVCSFALG